MIRKSKYAVEYTVSPDILKNQKILHFQKIKRSSWDDWQKYYPSLYANLFSEITLKPKSGHYVILCENHRKTHRIGDFHCDFLHSYCFPEFVMSIDIQNIGTETRIFEKGTTLERILKDKNIRHKKAIIHVMHIPSRVSI